MKKQATWVLVLVAALAFYGCGDNDSYGTDIGAAESTPTSYDDSRS